MGTAKDRQLREGGYLAAAGAEPRERPGAPACAPFDFDSTGYIKTATEVSSDNSALMRNIARHEHLLEQSIAGIARALLHIARGFGVELLREGAIRVTFDDSIIVDTYQEKKQDLSEVGVTMTVAEFRAKWYAESPEVSEEKAKALASSAD